MTRGMRFGIFATTLAVGFGKPWQTSLKHVIDSFLGGALYLPWVSRQGPRHAPRFRTRNLKFCLYSRLCNAGSAACASRRDLTQQPCAERFEISYHYHCLAISHSLRRYPPDRPSLNSPPPIWLSNFQSCFPSSRNISPRYWAHITTYSGIKRHKNNKGG